MLGILQMISQKKQKLQQIHEFHIGIFQIHLQRYETSKIWSQLIGSWQQMSRKHVKCGRHTFDPWSEWLVRISQKLLICDDTGHGFSVGSNPWCRWTSVTVVNGRDQCKGVRG
jgi:hypothetical protein